MERYTEYVPDTDLELRFRWYGGHTVNIFVADREVDVISLYPDGGRTPTADEVAEACEEYATEMLQEV